MASEIRVNKIENRSGLGTVTFADTGVDLAGIVTATTFSGSGASLTGLPAAQLSGALPAISGANLTNLAAANLTGTIADARFPATLPAASAANLTSIPAANVTGILPALTAANLTNIPAANLVGVCTSGLTKTGGFGKIVQVVQTVKTDTTSTSSGSFVDISGMSRSISFTSGNKVLVEFSASIGSRYGYPAFFQLHTNNGVVSGAIGDSSSTRQQCTVGGYIGSWDLQIVRVHFSFLDSPADSVTEYKVQWRSESNGNQAIYLNHDWNNQDNANSPRTISSLTCTEIVA